MNDRKNSPLPLRFARIDLRLALGLFSLLLICGLWLGALKELATSRQNNLEDARRDAQSLSRLFLEHAYRTIEAADQAAVYLRYRYGERGQNLDLATEIANGLVARNVYNLFSIVDSKGDVALSSKPFTPINLSDREHIQVHMHGGPDKLFISKPVLGRVSNKWSLQLTRRINHPDGSFGGVVVVSMDPQYFTSLYHQIDVGHHGVITLLGADGVVRVRRTGEMDAMGEQVSGGKVYAAMLAQGDGVVEAVSRIDGRERIYAFHKLRDYPLYASVGIDIEERLAPYYRERNRTLLLATLITLAVLLFNALLIWLAGSLVKSRQDAMQASHAKSRFLSNMSHEFRTPLNGVLGYSDALREELGESPLAQYATAIHDSGNRLLDLVNAILEVTELEDQRVAIQAEPENIRELISQAVARHYPDAQAKGLSLECRIGDEVPQVVVCDQRKVLRVLENLLGNAVRYTDSGRILVEVERSGSQLSVRIKDTGIGIPAGQLDTIFEKFTQADDSERRARDGAGLGLTIAQRLVTLMGGKLMLQSKQHQGSTFSFTLPLQEPK
ncbi:two component sensor histidine kinase protein [Herbaspirillum rubrisubalbicans M1]|uniref:cache domain-containing sensor histidine kinase n=1 Tax=Herbaspirillum rubrisubalbicans TaxID=80842 RepID=UPI00073A73E1|nr:ATP-binding protein [Herbaspirillum rubrisubalbicans]ALU90853.1 two component sensor histidine kinase protein [Herbaspirillum rubrisubalbicans M1]